MDLVEVRCAPGAGTDASEGAQGDLFTALEVRPVDYKAGAPKEGTEANELWDTDKMQLGLQALILRDNGYSTTATVLALSKEREPQGSVCHLTFVASEGCIRRHFWLARNTPTRQSQPGH
jgi:hypothetical protein